MGLAGSNNGNSNSGAVAVFVRNIATDTWSQQAYIKASNVDTNDHLGVDMLRRAT